MKVKGKLQHFYTVTNENGEIPYLILVTSPDSLWTIRDFIRTREDIAELDTGEGLKANRNLYYKLRRYTRAHPELNIDVGTKKERYYIFKCDMAKIQVNFLEKLTNDINDETLEEYKSEMEKRIRDK